MCLCLFGALTLSVVVMAFIPHSAVQRFLEAFLTWIEGLNFWASAELIIVTCVACTHIHTRVVRSTFVLCSGHVSVCIVSRVADSYAVGLLFMLPGTPWNLAAGTHCHFVSAYGNGPQSWESCAVD